MSKILIYAIPFGGGPTGKATVIANHLKSSHHVTLTSYSHAVNLLKLSSKGVEVFDCQSRASETLTTMLKGGIDVFISVMDVRVANFVKKTFPSVRVILIDSLLSWRLREYTVEELADLDLIDFHICQYVPSLETDTLVAKLRDNLSKLRIIAPIVQPPTIKNSLNKDRGILIHVGGLSSPVINWNLYLPFLEKLTEILIVNYAPYTKLLFVGGMDVINHLRLKFISGKNVLFECLSYQKFQEAIIYSKLVLTTPGIETAYESFFIGKPVLFLPALNSTQLHQLKFFEAAGLPNVVPPSERYRFNDISNSGEHYSTKTMRICELVNALIEEDSFQNYLENSVNRLLKSKIYIKKLVKEQKRFLPKCLENGLQLINEIIEGNIIKN